MNEIIKIALVEDEAEDPTVEPEDVDSSANVMVESQESVQKVAASISASVA